MRFKRFEIRNFKGIEAAVLDLVPAGANVFTLIGLNESGKTTILEALSMFSLIKDDTGALYGAGTDRPPPTSYVPKNLKSNFTGNITVCATVCLDDDDRVYVEDQLRQKNGSKLIVDSLPYEIDIVRGYLFENSDFKKTIYNMHISPSTIAKGRRKAREIKAGDDDWSSVTAAIASRVPQILYFPTFLFNQPDKIFLNPDKQESATNRLYREIIQDIASSLKNPLDVKKHIVDRIVTVETSIDKFINMMTVSPDKKQQIEAALSEMSAHVTDTVFESWSKTFGGDFKDREIVLRPGVEATAEGSSQVYIQFSIKDGRQNYDITERSLGFRWFFSFLLFTVYRVWTEKRGPVLFLLDEPASNLHSRAQMQLLNSFSRIATGDNQIMYSTHSHYMVNPEWLDQAFIVSNAAIDYERVDEGNQMVRGRASNVSVERYRTFVGQNPSKTTYFQPVLDKLDVVPSRMDLVRKSILVEGKGDYRILEYGRRVIARSDSDVAVVPTRGAAGMNELIGLFLGWGVSFAICLDDDREGRKCKKQYIEGWGLAENQVFTLGDLSSELENCTIEDLLDDADISLVSKHFGIVGKPSKGQLQLFFGEHLAKKAVLTMSRRFHDAITAFEDRLEHQFRPEPTND